MRFSTYNDYQGTDFSWLGKIPRSWGIKRVGHHVDFTTGFAFKSEFFSFEKGIKLVRGDNVTEGNLRWGDKTRYWPEVTKDIEQYLLKDKDILIGMDGSKVGKNFTVIQEADLPLLLVQRVARLRTDKHLSYKFLTYLIGSELFRTWVALVKTDPAIPHISPADIRGFPLPFPSIEEQEQIGNFLDHETAKIDTLIDKQQQLIKLLKEKRQAVISHAVTKGLNPAAPMKDSGVEWLGEVPEHWGVTRAKYESKIFVPQRNKPELNDSQGVAWATMEDMKQQYISDTSRYVSSESALAAGSKKLKAGSVIASCVGNFGVTSINKVDVIINQQLQAFQPVNIKAEYLQSIVALSKQYFELIGTAATLVYVNQEGFENLPVLAPPAKEQNEICDYVLGKSAAFDILIEKSVIQTSLLKERRTALISAAVTGKIDVRNWQAPATQEAQQQEAS